LSEEILVKPRRIFVVSGAREDILPHSTSNSAIFKSRGASGKSQRRGQISKSIHDAFVSVPSSKTWPRKGSPILVKDYDICPQPSNKLLLSRHVSRVSRVACLETSNTVTPRPCQHHHNKVETSDDDMGFTLKIVNFWEKYAKMWSLIEVVLGYGKCWQPLKVFYSKILFNPIVSNFPNYYYLNNQKRTFYIYFSLSKI